MAASSPDRRKEIASKGGASVPAELRSFSQNRELAAAAGRKGGRLVPPQSRSFSTNRVLAVEAGRKGGRVSRGRKRKESETVERGS